jgi:acyl transferase domain-containing protein/acyl-CoA synthetase (AMP-forming)/AMP-acid ligase II/acyl carrier protein/2-polyprenyl-3-methyl-5-hydroxy-6-metoxy-1,4-benzoquinol methylase
VYDIFGLLAAGGTIVMPDAGASDPGHWADLIRRHGVTIWNSAPPLMGILADAMESESAPARGLSSLRLVLLSGDWIPVPLPDRVRRLSPDARVVSLGGATEGSIWSICYPIDAVDPNWDSIPYGAPLPNQHMYVLNKALQPSPDWVTGDIYIGGLGVALGYWKDPDKTGRQFIVHPTTGARLYVTGDLGRVRADGQIEFLGREDSQIKLRGHRVELGEIAACLRSHPDVRDGVVQVVTEAGRMSLNAYVVAERTEGSELFERVDVSTEHVQQVSSRLEDAVRSQEAAADHEGLETFWTFWQAIERVCLQSMLETVQGLDLVSPSAAADRLDDLVRTGRVLPQYRPLVEHWLQVLAAAGQVIRTEGRYAAAPRLSAVASAEEQLVALERSCGRDDRVNGFLEHVASSVRQRFSLLCGDVAPLRLLFPDGSWRLADALYQSNPIARHHNGIIAAIVRRLVGTWVDDRRLRVLEIGAGTGGTSAAILPQFPASRTEYWYTDVSPYFFGGAKEKFGAYACIRYALFDIDADPKAQGYQPHRYDVVIAANVLHNAVDIDATLSRIRELLQPGGYLLLLEGTHHTPWMWATAGFLDLVRTYRDERSHSGGPGLSADAWSRALSRVGFPAVQTFPSAATLEADDMSRWLRAMPQHVMVAQGPASVRRFQPDSLAAFLRARLPDYMVPQRYLPLESLPLTANGKIDLGALAGDISSSHHAEDRPVVFPHSETEQRILTIWQEVLGASRLGVTDNFFEVGGDSLLIVEVLRRLNQSQSQFQSQSPPLTVAELFAYPTIQSLAAYLSPSRPLEPERHAVVSADADADAAAARGPSNADVAIIGMAGRFPEAANVEQLWENLAAGRCAVQQFSDEQLIEAGVTPEELAQEGYVKAGLVLAGMDLFDASFFGLSPRDAEIMDPQQRFLLECSVEALETAGYATERHAGRIGVFVGKGTNFYLIEHLLPHPEIVPRMGIMPVLTLNEKDYAATLVSYKLNLTGPSVSVNTACSTSLVAVHLACESVLRGECEVALAGGVSFVTTRARSGYRYQGGHILSPDGRCRAFSDDASGTVFGNGVALVVLKSLAAALRDGDTIHAVIKGSAINNDGSRKVGFTAPGLHGQADVIARAQARAGVHPDTIHLLEAHGTGTGLGDPVEFSALRKVFGGPRADGSRCALGSIKTNVGHLDAAAGVTGLIKAVLALKHRQIPPTLHVTVPTRQVDFVDSPFHLNSGLLEWRDGATLRRAGVSAFGVGGTNAHVVLEEAPPVAEARHAPDEPQEPQELQEPQVLPLSAKTPDSLTRMMHALADDIGARSDLSLNDVAFTLQVGRAAYPYRSYVVAGDLAGARRELGQERPSVVLTHDGPDAAVAFLFPGQGAQQVDASWELYETQPRFRAAFDDCADRVRQYADGDLRDWLYTARPRDAQSQSAPLDQTAFAQPVLFALEYALARFWESLGVRPVAMLGHSIGEYVAACLAGVFSLEEALSLVVVRGQLLQGLEPGRMLAASCSEARLRKFLAASACSLAAVNGETQCVASGTIDEIDTLQRRLHAAGIESRVLRTSHAFHSSMVEPILDRYERCVAEVRRDTPHIPFISNVSGTWITDAEATSPAYWARHLRETVRFADGLLVLRSIGNRLMLEVGPGHTLSTIVNREGGAARAVPSLGYGGSGRSEVRAVLDAVGRVWQHGVDIDWTALHVERPRRIPLPSYPFERQRYWIERRSGWGAVAPTPGPTPRQRQDGDEDVAEVEEHVAALPTYDRPGVLTDYVAPGNDIETTLAHIWQSALGIERIGVCDSFFELGGDSLVGIRMHEQISREFDVELPLAKLFAFTTIRRMSLYIRVARDPSCVDRLTPEELDDCLTVMDA